MLECVVNLSEGRDEELLRELAELAGDALLDLHRDRHHNRAVLTLVGEAAPRTVTRRAVDRLDLRRHEGVHPRLGVVDVVPFVPLPGSAMADAIEARDAFGRWAASELGVPAFFYGGDGPTLPDVRRSAWNDRSPDVGPREPHPSAGAVCVGARQVLVAYNLWVTSGDLGQARQAAAAMRGPHLRALGLRVGRRVQLSMNLIDPDRLGPADAYDLANATLRRLAPRTHDSASGAVSRPNPIVGAELVGLLPRAVLDRVPAARWIALDLSEECTIEARLAHPELRP